jgi:hypothetical protein
VQAAGAALQQAGAEPVFEAGDQFGEGRWGQAKLTGGCREAAGIDRADKGSHFSGAIHVLIMDENSQMFLHFTQLLFKQKVIRVRSAMLQCNKRSE